MAIAEQGPARQVSVIVFARRPRAGRVKRRLARTIGGPRAARIYAAILARTLQQVEQLACVRRILMPAARRDVAWFGRRYRRRGWQVRPQSQGDLGQRMARALAAEIGVGRTVLLLGSDIADFSAADLEGARTLLAGQCAAVLGPAADGGFWLIGLKRSVPDLFAGLRWGKPSVLAQTQAAFARHGVAVKTLAIRHDIDRASDLRFWGRFQRARARSRSSRAT